MGASQPQQGMLAEEWRVMCCYVISMKSCISVREGSKAYNVIVSFVVGVKVALLAVEAVLEMELELALPRACLATSRAG